MIGSMSTDPEDKLIAAAYSATLSPMKYHELVDLIDDFIFDAKGPTTFRPEGSDQYQLNQDLILHFERARDIHSRLGRQAHATSPALSMIEEAPSPAIIFDRHNMILAYNAMARNLCPTSLETLSDFCNDDDCFAAIQRYTSAAKSDNVFIQSGKLRTDSPADSCIIIRAISEQDLGSSFDTIKNPEPYFFLTSSDLGFDDMKIKYFQTAYQLTQAETDVAIHLASGRQPQEIAFDRVANLSTIRTQIKSIKSKTGCRDIPGIVRLVCGFSASMFISSQLSGMAESYTQMLSKDKKLSTLILRDGRKMTYLTQGAPDGIPVIFIHNMMFGAELPDAAAQAAAKLNLRILTPFRPGYGQSDIAKHAQGDKLLNLVAADLQELLDHHHIQKAMVLGQTVGAVYAMRFCRLFPSRVSALFSVGFGHLWRDKWLQDLPKAPRMIARIARFTPRILPLVARTAVARIDHGETVKFIRTMYQNSPSDLRALDIPEVAAQAAKGFETHVRQGEDAFCRDVLFNITDYTDEVRGLPLKFHVFHGDGDLVVPLARIQDYAREVPGTTIEMVEDGAQFILQSHWRQVLDGLRKTAAT